MLIACGQQILAVKLFVLGNFGFIDFEFTAF